MDERATLREDIGDAEMKAAKRAKLTLAIERYTKAKRASKAIALASLVKEGTHTEDGRITAEYGGVDGKSSDSR